MGYEAFLGVNIWTALFTLANTIAIFLVGKKFLWKPILKMIEDRQNEIDSQLQEAKNAKEEAAKTEAEYKQQLLEAQAASERMVREAVARAQGREEEILRQANMEAVAIKERASADIAQEKKKAINEAKDEISGMAMAIAEKVVGRELNAADQSKLVDSFIEELGSV
ncbi:MAG: F0F1 ATP synthase subunit B [Faecousia sp.]